MRTPDFLRRLALVAAVPALVLAAPQAAPAAQPGPAARAAAADAEPLEEPVVVGHRGASGYRPEHTLEAYRLAIAMGADYIEPDLVSTKDGVLVARHENEISGTTDVADHPRFAERYTTKVIDGVRLSGWFTEDFTLAELKTLRAKERIPQIRPRNTAYDGRYKIPTLAEVIRLARVEGRRARRTVGIYPETKHPTYFDSIGLSLEEPLVRTLRRARLAGADAPVFVQSFETSNLRDLDAMIDAPLVQLIGGSGAPYDLVAAGDPRTYADLVTPAGLAEIATYADGIGPDKNRVIPRDTDGRLTTPTSLVADAHAEGLLVHPYTFRSENFFLPTELRIGSDPTAYGDHQAEYEAFLDAGIDGMFSDHPDHAVAAVRAHEAPAATRAAAA